MFDPWHPCSGYAEVDGYVWLPRMLDKARRSLVGDLGPYWLFGASPMDRAAMKHFRQPPEQFMAWLRAGLDDAAIARAIAEALGEDAAARRAWSRRMVALYGIFMTGLDADEGRMAPGAGATFFRAFYGVVYRVAGALRL